MAAGVVSYMFLYCGLSTHDVHQKDRKEEETRTVDVPFFLGVF